MTTFKPKWYPQPVTLPERTSGRFSIRHRVLPIGHTVPVVGQRQAALRGVPYETRTLTEPLRVTELYEQGVGMWMSDNPEELNQIGEMLTTVGPIQGRVLVGGLGLGILANAVAERGNEVVVVERSTDVVALVAPPDAPYKVVVENIHAYLRHSRERFDYYLLDTWQGTGEGTWFEQVMPLRRHIRNRWGSGPLVHCWFEHVMHAQVAEMLCNGQRVWYYKDLPVPMLPRQAREFLRDVGLPSWERHYGAAMDRITEEAPNAETPTAP